MFELSEAPVKSNVGKNKVLELKRFFLHEKYYIDQVKSVN